MKRPAISFNISRVSIKYMVLMIIIFMYHPLFSNDRIPELEAKLIGMVEDTAKANILLQLGEHYCSIDNDKALEYLQEAFTISTLSNYKAGTGKSMLWQGRVYYYKDDYRLGLKYLDKAKIHPRKNE